MEDCKKRYKELLKYNMEELYQNLSIYLINNNRLEDTKILDKLFLKIVTLIDNNKVFTCIRRFVSKLTESEYLTIYNIVCSYISYLYKNIEAQFINGNNNYILNSNLNLYSNYLFSSFIISILNLSRFSCIKSNNKKIKIKDIKLILNNLYKDIYYKSLIDNRRNICNEYSWRFEGNLFNFSRIAYMYHLDKDMFNNVMNINNNFLVDLFYDGYMIDEIIVMDKELYERFKNRKYLLPKEGILLTNIYYNGVGNIVIRERLIDGKIWILIYYKLGSNFYPLFINLIDKYTLFVHRSYTRALEIILKFYGIKPDVDILTDSETYPGEYFTYNGNGYVTKSSIKPIYKIEGVYKIKKLNINKETYVSFKDKIQSNNIKINQTIKLSPYKRKLVKGQHASQAAIEYAKKYCLNLENNETIVREHIKKIKVNSSVN